VEAALKQAFKDGSPLSVIIFGIKNFDAVMKALGPAKTNALVEELVQAAGAKLRRKADMAMRGERHILAMLPGTDKTGALATLERLKGVFDNHSLSKEIGMKLEIAPSVVNFPKDAATKEEYLGKIPL